MGVAFVPGLGYGPEHRINREPTYYRGDQPPLRMYLSLVLSLVCYFSSSVFFFGRMGHRRLGSPTVTAGFCAARGFAAGHVLETPRKPAAAMI